MKVRYYGHAGQTTGYGIAAEHTIRALLRVGIDVEIRTLAPYHTLQWSELPLTSYLRTDEQLDPAPDVVIVHTVPTACTQVVAVALQEGSLVLGRTFDHPDDVGNGIPVVAYTTWECDSPAPPMMLEAMSLFDQVWTPSLQSLVGFRGLHSFERPVIVVPHAYDFDRHIDTPNRIAKPGDSKRHRFYYVGAWNYRKNPAGVVRAYAHAFAPKDNVELLLHLPGSNKETLAYAMCATGIAPEDFPAFRVTFDHVPRENIDMLHQHADCFVTATRGEGWNLPAFEAMVAGRMVIAPMYMGHDDFLSGTSARLYPSHAVPASFDVVKTGENQIQPHGAQGASGKDLFREPYLLALASHMREVYEQRQRSIEVRYSPRERYGYDAVGQKMKTALEAVLA